jgi:hypothetical protein
VKTGLHKSTNFPSEIALFKKVWSRGAKRYRYGFDSSRSIPQQRAAARRLSLILPVHCIAAIEVGISNSPSTILNQLFSTLFNTKRDPRVRSVSPVASPLISSSLLLESEDPCCTKSKNRNNEVAPIPSVRCRLRNPLKRSRIIHSNDGECERTAV